MKKLILLIVSLSLSFTLFAQNRKILTPDGKLHSINEVMRVKQVNEGNHQTREFTSPNSANNLIDTLEFTGPWDVNFGFFGQDWLLQWFQAPVDLILKKVGFACYENPDMMSVEVKVVTVNWSKAELLAADVAWRGYYESTGNGYNDITAFLDNGDITGGWTSIQPGDSEPFGHDIWVDSGPNSSIIPTCNNTTPTLLWVDLSILGEPQLNIGDIFGIAIKHTSPNMDENRIGFWAHQYDPPIPAWKFYANGRLEPGIDFGWWTTEYTIDFAAEVDLITDVDDNDDIKPEKYSLYQNYPNPFNPSTRIKYALSSRQYATLKVYDILGNEVAILVNEEKPAGEYEVEFSVAQNSILSSGIYFYQLRAGSFIETKKMILLK